MKPNEIAGGYEYNAYANQAAAMECGLLGKLHTEELMILEMFIKYTTWTNAEKDIYEGEVYWLFDWRIVPQRLPFIKAKARTAVKDRIKNLVTVQLLKAHPNNQKLAKPFYTFGALYPSFANIKPNRKHGQHPSASTDRPNRKGGQTRPSKRTAPVRRYGCDPSADTDVYDVSSDISNDIFLEKDFSIFKTLKFDWKIWKKYLEQKHNIQPTEEEEKIQLSHLANCGKNDVTEMKAIITQAMSGGYKNFIPLIGKKNTASSTSNFPNEWSKTYESRLKPEQLQAYWKHLRGLGLRPERHNGQIVSWEKIELQTNA